VALTVALSSIKGGVGKTSASVNLAALSAQDGRRTLLWDLDPQGASTFALQVSGRVPGGARRIVRRKPGIASAIMTTAWERLDVIPADFSLRHLDIELNETDAPRRRLRQTLARVVDDYDSVFIDCPPGITLAIESALRATDVVLVPVVPSVLPMRSYEQLVAYVTAERKLERAEVLAFLSMVDRRKKLHRELCDGMSASRDERVLHAAIPASVHVETMAERRAPLVETHPRAAAALAYRALWDELLDRAD
jgi:cellulose biosynthesis protein BcsQ